MAVSYSQADMSWIVPPPSPPPFYTRLLDISINHDLPSQSTPRGAVEADAGWVSPPELSTPFIHPLSRETISPPAFDHNDVADAAPLEEDESTVGDVSDTAYQPESPSALHRFLMPRRSQDRPATAVTTSSTRSANTSTYSLLTTRGPRSNADHQLRLNTDSDLFQPYTRFLSGGPGYAGSIIASSYEHVRIFEKPEFVETNNPPTDLQSGTHAGSSLHLTQLPPEILLNLLDALPFPDAFALSLTCRFIHDSVARSLRLRKRLYASQLRSWLTRQNKEVRACRKFCSVCLYLLPTEYFRAAATGGLKGKRRARVVMAEMMSEVRLRAQGVEAPQDAERREEERHQPQDPQAEDEPQPSQSSTSAVEGISEDEDKDICTDCLDLRRRAQREADGSTWTLAHPVWRRSRRVSIEGHGNADLVSLWFRDRE